MPVIEEVVVEQCAPNQIPFVTVDTKFFKKFFQLCLFRHADRMAAGNASVLDKAIGAFKVAGLQNVPTMLSQIPAQLCILPCPFRKASLRFCSLRSSFIIFRPSCADTRICTVLLSALALFIKQRFYSFIVYHILPLLTTYKP